MTETRIAITTPPSVNALYVNKRRGRAKSPRYRQWIQLAGMEVLEQRRKITRISGPYSVLIKVARETRGDIDNRAKACLDLLVSMGITEDDKHCQKVTIERGSMERYSEVFVSSVGGGNGLDGRVD